MNDLETTALSARLHTLADELTPGTDPVAQVRAARSRHRRQRRNRVALSGLVVAVAALVVAVPAAIGTLSATPERGEVAGPSLISPEKTPGPPLDAEDAGKASRWDDVLAERDERDERLRPFAERLAAALSARATRLSLIGPPVDDRCPDWAAALPGALGVPVEGPDGALPSGCRWSGGNDVVVEVAFVAGSTTREELGADASAEANGDFCYVHAMPNAGQLTPLLLCEKDDALEWRLQSLDDNGAGVWRLTVTLADTYPEDGVAVLAALADLADRTW